MPKPRPASAPAPAATPPPATDPTDAKAMDLLIQAELGEMPEYTVAEKIMNLKNHIDSCEVALKQARHDRAINEMIGKQDNVNRCRLMIFSNWKTIKRLKPELKKLESQLPDSGKPADSAAAK